MFGGISFLNPIALLFGIPVVGLLVYAYLRRGKGQKKIVASVYLMQQLSKKSFARKKFKPPWRFFLELLALLLLLLGVAGLSMEKGGGTFALLVDNSLSMSATVGYSTRGKRGEIVLERAVDQARGFVTGLRGGAQVEIYLTSPALHKITQDGISPTEASARLGEIDFSYGSDNLISAINSLTQEERFSGIAVFSDKQLNAKQEQEGLEQLESLQFFSVGTGNGANQSQSALVENISIQGVRFVGDVSKDGFVNLEATVAAFTTREVEIDVSLDEFTPTTGQGSFSEYRTSSVILDPGARKVVTFSKVPVNSSFLVKVKTRQELESNRILWDDTGWISNAATASGALVVSSDSPKELGLSRLSTLKFTHSTPERFERDYLETLIKRERKEDRFSMVIFHRYVPSDVPEINSLFVAPEAGKDLIQVGQAEDRSEVTRWLEAHPVTSYLNMPALSLPAMTPLYIPAWGQELIATTRGTAAFLGSIEKRKHVVLGFEIFPYRASESPVLSILTLNITRWLSQGSGVTDYVQASTPFELEEAGKVRHVSIEGVVDLEQESGVVVPEQPGFLVIDSSVARLDVVPVNYFNEKESDLRNREEVRISELRKVPGKDDRDSLVSLQSILAWIVLLLLLVDIAVVILKVGRSKTSSSVKEKAV